MIKMVVRKTDFHIFDEQKHKRFGFILDPECVMNFVIVKVKKENKKLSLV